VTANPVSNYAEYYVNYSSTTIFTSSDVARHFGAQCK
jgi:hypothetical protein